MIQHFPSSGSIFTYVSHVFGKLPGFIAGWLMLLQYLVSPAMVYLLSLIHICPRAIFGQLARATRGVHERRLNLEAVRSSRGCNEGDDGVVRGWEAQSREARAALVPLPGL